MNKCDKLFLEAFRASLENRKVEWEFEITPDEWVLLFRKAEIHQVLPLIFEAVYACPAIRGTDFSFYNLVKRRCMENMILQAQKTAEFLRIYGQLQENGVNALVVKGLVCRQLYPNPDLRASADEDLLVTWADFEKSIEIMKNLTKTFLGHY